MAYKDMLGDRMKNNYENISKTKLMRRTPVAIRIDGRAHHTFTRGFKKPFDDIYMKSMQETMKYLCENIQGAIIGYTQSDEITIILQDYKKLETAAWFDYEVQKVCSISASMATMAFNKSFTNIAIPYCYENEDIDELSNYCDKLLNAVDKGAQFDSRCFNIPKEEVTNLIFWRQQDAARNSVQMVGRAYYSHKELHNKNNSQIQDMLMNKGINWNDFPTHQKRGSCCIKDENGRWFIDTEIPMFKGEGREYIEKILRNVETCEEEPVKKLSVQDMKDLLNNRPIIRF